MTLCRQSFQAKNNCSFFFGGVVIVIFPFLEIHVNRIIEDVAFIDWLGFF